MGRTIKYKGFEAMVDYSKEDREYYGTVLHIEDYLCFSGESWEELEDKFRESIDNYLEMIKIIQKTDSENG